MNAILEILLKPFIWRPVKNVETVKQKAGSVDGDSDDVIEILSSATANVLSTLSTSTSSLLSDAAAAASAAVGSPGAGGGGGGIAAGEDGYSNDYGGMVDSTEWAPITLTLVEYPKDDSVGFVYAAASLTPLIIIVGFITLILFRRDLWTVSDRLKMHIKTSDHTFLFTDYILRWSDA